MIPMALKGTSIYTLVPTCLRNMRNMSNFVAVLDFLSVKLLH